MSFPIDPTLMGLQPPPIDPMIGAMGATPPMGPPSPMGPPPMAPMAPVVPDPMGLDPVLAALSQAPKIAIDPEMLLRPSQRRGYFAMPDEGYIKEVTNGDQMYYQPLLARFARDLTLYRQRHPYNVPPGFHPYREVAFRVATLSNIVNKLANMMSGTDWRHIVPFKDEKSKEDSQVVENWLSYLRQCEEEDYAIGGGGASLQYDECWYLLLYGRAVTRIVPDPSDPHHPFNESLLDPSTCFPVFGDSKEGMIRMTRKYDSTVAKVIGTYGTWNAKRGIDLNAKMLDAIGSEAAEVGRFYHETGTVTEYWDTWNRAVYFRDVEVMKDSHELGYVPFVYVTARGEPRGVVTPEGHGIYQIDEYNNAVVSASTREDLTEKGISVFHHLINTHKMSEIVHTLMLSEVLKSQNPATITYSIPQLANIEPEPLGFYPAASNQRVLNAQQVEIVPTSPRPTDVSPVLNKLQADTVEGSINPAMYGSMDGSNIAGFAVESLISAARDTILPYTQAFERFQGLKARMRAKQFVTHIAPKQGPMSVSMEGRYGSSPSAEVTAEVVKSSGYKITVEMVGVSDSALPAIMNMSSQAVKEGIKSRRWAMEKTGDKDPDKMFRDIIAERAIEHPEIMENFIIPQVFIKNGQQELARLWGFLVVLPKMIQTFGAMGGMMPPGMGTPGTGPGMVPQPPTGPQPNGMSNPMMGIPPGPPTGPLPGQGRS